MLGRAGRGSLSSTSERSRGRRWRVVRRALCRDPADDDVLHAVVLEHGEDSGRVERTGSRRSLLGGASPLVSLPIDLVKEGHHGFARVEPPSVPGDRHVVRCRRATPRALQLIEIPFSGGGVALGGHATGYGRSGGPWRPRPADPVSFPSDTGPMSLIHLGGRSVRLDDDGQEVEIAEWPLDAVSEMYQSAEHRAVSQRPQQSVPFASCLLNGTMRHEPVPAEWAPTRFGCRRSGFKSPLPDHS